MIPYVRGGLSLLPVVDQGAHGRPGQGAATIARAAECDSEDKAYGGTPGVRKRPASRSAPSGSTPSAARSMRNSGILHAGFYGEVFWGRVDGFGSSSKLWVGDTTWFAGANFES